MVASTIAMMVSPNSMIKLGGYHVFLFLIFDFSVENLTKREGRPFKVKGITFNYSNNVPLSEAGRKSQCRLY